MERTAVSTKRSHQTCTLQDSPPEGQLSFRRKWVPAQANRGTVFRGGQGRGNHRVLNNLGPDLGFCVRLAGTWSRRAFASGRDSGRDRFQLLQVIQIVTRHGLDDGLKRQFPALRVGHLLSELLW